MTDVIHPFDLQARAALAARSLTALLDAERDGLMYFLGTWRARPPRAHHCLWDYGDGSGRQIDALVLARTMARAGSDAAQRNRGEEQLEGWMLRMLGADGLSWLPAEELGKPWGIEQLLIDWQPGTPAAEISWAQRGTLMGLVSRFMQTSDERYRELACRMVDGLLAAAVRHPRGLYFPEGYYRPGGWSYDRPGLHDGIEEYNAAIVPPAVRLYEVCGYQPALDLAGGLVDFTLFATPCYRPDGRFRPTSDTIESHFHTRSNFILGVLKLGLAARRRELVSWARQSYDQAREWGTDFGWFPEGLGLRHGETCCTTDMIEIALLLGKHVDRSYYGDAERYGRNHLIESQFVSRERLSAAVDRLPPEEESPPLDRYSSTDAGVLDTQVGAFAARSTLNDAFHLDATAMMQCCNAAGTRALYDLWHCAVDDDDQAEAPRRQVHLRFSVATPSLTVRSYEPAQGRLDLRPRDACELEVRLPEGTSQALVVFGAQGGAQPRVEAIAPRQGYIRARVAAGATIEVHYPLVEREAHYVVGAGRRVLECSGSWRGETLMHIDPPGNFYPLYDRSAMLEPVEPSPGAGTPIASL